jgi:chemotaxis signal transduction protein
MPEATAWIVHLDSRLCLALGEHEIVHFVERPVFEDIPHTPAHCHQVLLWEGELLPVLDLAAWLTDQPVARPQAAVSIVRWQAGAETALQYGALLCTGIPQKVRVKDEHGCDLPAQPSGWQDVAISCFTHNGQPVPIVDVPYVFSGALVRPRP